MSTEDKDSIAKNITRYSSGNIYRQLLGILNAFIRPKLLTPELYGLWHILIIIPRYAAFSNLGLHSIIRYLIPYNEARNEHQKNIEIESNAFYGSLIPKLLIAIVLIVVSVIAEMSLKVRLGLLTMAYVVIMEWYYSFHINVLKSYQNFKLVVSAFYLKATVAFAGSAILIYFFSIYGVYLSAFLTFMIVNSYLRVKYPLDSHHKFNYSLFSDLVKQGLPVMLFSFSAILISTSDRIIIAYFLGSEQLGYYGIAVMVFGFIMQIPGAARTIIEPKLMENIHEGSKEENLKEYLLKPLINTAYLVPFLIGPVFIILPVLIPLILPRYVPGILPAQIIVLGAYFLSLSYLARGFIVANKWQLKALAVMIYVLLINIGLSIYLLKSGLGLKGVAIASSTSFFLLFISLLIFIRIKCNYARQDWKTNISGFCWPFPIMCIAILVLQYFSKFVPINHFAAVFLDICVFCLIMLIVKYLAGKKYFLLKGIKLKEIW